MADERSVSRDSLNLLLKAGLGLLLGRKSLCVLNHSGIITALKSSCTEIPRCLASVSRSVKVCGPKATITLTDVWVSTHQYPAILEGLSGRPWRMFGYQIILNTAKNISLPEKLFRKAEQ